MILPLKLPALAAFLLLLGSAISTAATPAVSAGTYFSLSLGGDGTVWATGQNTSGQLGDGTGIDRPRPVPVINDVQAISAGYGHSLFLKTDGTAWATGDNSYGQLGVGTGVTRLSPVQVLLVVFYHPSLLHIGSVVSALKMISYCPR